MPIKKKVNTKKRTVKKVAKALNKASKSHAKQARMLSALKMKKGATPTNPSLYARVKAEAKRKFKVYPSAYANGWVVREYKKRGGGYR